MGIRGGLERRHGKHHVAGVRDENGRFLSGWAVPYAPFARGHGGMAYGNGIVGTIFSQWNNYQPSGNPPPDGQWRNPNDAHIGSTAWFYGADPTVAHKMAYSTGDHSLDQRMIFTEGRFYSISLGPHLVFQSFDIEGNRIGRKVLFDEPVAYSGNTAAPTKDLGAMEVRGHDGSWQSRTNFLEAKGYTLGRLGDMHALGNGRLALTYGYDAWSDRSRNRSSKNQVDIAILDTSGQVLTRKIVAKPDTRAGQDKYTEFFPYERLKCVKSVRFGANIVVVWAVQRDGSRRLPVFMTVVSQNGDLLQDPHEVDESISFSFNDRLHNLSDGSIVWTTTQNNSLQLYRLGG